MNRFAVVNARTGHVVNAGITYEYFDLATMAALDLSTTYPDMEFTVAQVSYVPAAASV